MLISLVLGIGVPTTVNYIITSTIVSSAIVMTTPAMIIALGTDALYLTTHILNFSILADVAPKLH